MCKLAFMARPTDEHVGSRLAKAMLETGHRNARGEPDRAWLAKELGVSIQAVGQALTGATTFTAENLLKAARALERDAWWLVTGEEADAPPGRQSGDESRRRDVSDSELAMLDDLRAMPEEKLAQWKDEAAKNRANVDRMIAQRNQAAINDKRLPRGATPAAKKGGASK